MDNDNSIHAVCVYCGSSVGNDLAFMNAGTELGRALAEGQLKLIYGGGTTGLMGAVARGTLDVGGQVGAIIPSFLINREANQESLTLFEDLTITDTMHERKHQMFERSDAFVALPGGLGTVEEIVEIMTWGQLGQHCKPIVLLNINGFWNPLLALLNHLRDTGFIHSDHLLRLIVVERVEDVVPAILAAESAAGVSSEGEPTIIEKL
ncbi:LOG family protein [Rhizobium rhizogenes]|uniref:LOG family protein n=1 Tax=Rhizobium rhizogenes TaxID=359 RepID=UPI001571BD32|nr:TIGR00730 family Rossman fold protein [Rhizobium rhizogenes]NTH23325.1 TIGR00730 family Rossman fold protein [Rhizobium rhizogenes]NTH36347.1 TIGR00730 family Rossman fold protein [Rhizobium rhizogenes]